MVFDKAELNMDIGFIKITNGQLHYWTLKEKKEFFENYY